MTTIYYDTDATVDRLSGSSIAVVGYGNQGRSWALNLRDSLRGSSTTLSVHARADESRRRAEADGFAVGELEQAGAADIVCVLVPDDAIPALPIDRSADGLTIVASGYVYAFDRWSPPGDLAMVAPRMLGPEVRRCYEEGVGFITAVGVHRDTTGTAQPRTLAVAAAIGGLRQGAIEMTAHQEAVLDLAVEQLLSPALTHVNGAFVGLMLDAGIPLEAVITELTLSGEIERNYRLLREEGFVAQLDHHSPTSQYGQLSRRGRFDHLDVRATMADLLDDITSGRFADEWDGEREAGHATLAALRDRHAGEAHAAFERELRSRLGEGARPRPAD